MIDSANIMNCLTKYEKASGQPINFEKSALSFSPNTSVDIVDAIKTMFKIPVVQGHAFYLGLPTFSMRSKRVQFSYIKEKVLKKLRSWGHKVFQLGKRSAYQVCDSSNTNLCYVLFSYSEINLRRY